MVHEIGHYIHDQYLGNKPFYFKTKDATDKQNSKRNALENFADAFQEYINERIPDTTSRYKKMKNLMDDLKAQIENGRKPLGYPQNGFDVSRVEEMY